jgi:uncharacterized protein (TIGR02266 family)
MDPDQEKRSDPRVPLVLRVEYPGQAQLVRDATENLSAGGLFVRTERPLAPGERLPLQVSFPGLLAPLTVEVEVVRARRAGPEGPAGVAVQVPADRVADRQALARLAELAGAGGGPAREARERAFDILVVEDNHHVVEMYEYALRKLRSGAGAVKVGVRFASNGHEALAALAQARADLVMADLYMPVMDGFTLVERLRADPNLARLPIMIISAGGADARARALELGVDVYLQKPVQFSDIIGTVRTLLRLGA